MCRAVDFLGDTGTGSSTTKKWDCCSNQDTALTFCEKRSIASAVGITEGKAGVCQSNDTPCLG